VGYYHELKLMKLMQECPMKSTHEIPKGCRECMYFQPDWKYRKIYLISARYTFSLSVLSLIA